MKLRIRKNTIRLRLKQGEVERIAAGKGIVETTPFPGSVLTYSLGIAGGATAAARFDQGRLTVELPASEVRQWADSDQVSIVAVQQAGESESLSILVEKDFQCLSPGHHRPGEDDADTYPHPEANSGLGC